MKVTPWPMNTWSSIVTPSQMKVWLEILQRRPTLAFFWISTNAPIFVSSPISQPYRLMNLASLTSFAQLDVRRDSEVFVRGLLLHDGVSFSRASHGVTATPPQPACSPSSRPVVLGTVAMSGKASPPLVRRRSGQTNTVLVLVSDHSAHSLQAAKALLS